MTKDITITDEESKKVFDWKQGTYPANIQMALFRWCRAERIKGIEVRSDGRSLVFPVFLGSEAVRSVKVDGKGMLLEEEKDLQNGEFILIGKDTPEYIVKDIASAIVIFNTVFDSVAVCMNQGNLADVAKRFPEAMVVVGEFDTDAAEELSSGVININDFGGDKTEKSIFEGFTFATVRDFYVAGGDVNVMLKTGKPTRMEPLWWGTKRAHPVSWIIEGVIQEGPCLVSLIAPTNIGKTYIAIHTGLVVASGLPKWFGGHKSRKETVLYLLAEGTDGIYSRIQCWLEQHKVYNTIDIPFYLDGIPFSFDNEIDYKKFEKIFEKHFADEKPGLVIVDTMNLYMEGDENSTQDASNFVKALKEFSIMYETSIMLVHHTGLKDLYRGRGSSVLKGAVDIELLASLDGYTITLEQTKARNSEFMDPIYLKREVHPVEAFRNKKTGEAPTDCILVEVAPPRKRTFSEGELFLIDFCVSRAKNGQSWKTFTRFQLVDYGKMKWPDKTNIPTELNPTQPGKRLYNLVEKKVIVEVEGFMGEEAKRGRLENASFSIVDSRIIREIEKRLAEDGSFMKSESETDVQ